MCDPVTITVMALSYAANEQAIKEAERAEADRAARDLQHQTNVIESSTAAAIRAFSSQQSAEAQEQKSIGEEIAMIKGEEKVLKSSARVTGASQHKLGTQAMSNLNQILTSKASAAILTKEDEGEGLAQAKRIQGEETEGLHHARMTEAMAIPEQKMKSSDKNLSRAMALVQGYLAGSSLAAAPAAGTTTAGATTPVATGAAGASLAPATAQASSLAITPLPNPVLTPPPSFLAPWDPNYFKTTSMLSIPPSWY